MKAVVIEESGGSSVLEQIDIARPPVKDDEVLIRVAATTVNKFDLTQRKIPLAILKGSQLIPGLECSGHVIDVGRGVTKWKIGDKVCALLNGGGYAEEVVVPARQVLRVPSNVSLLHAAGLPEAACIAWFAIFARTKLSAKLSVKQTLLIHDGCSEIGVFAIQTAKYMGVRVFVAAASDEKLALCKSIGADVCINPNTENLVARVRQETAGRGIIRVNVILDTGAANLQNNLEIIARGGAVAIVHLNHALVTELDVRLLMKKNASVRAIDRLNTWLYERASVVDEVEKHIWPAIEGGFVKHVPRYMTMPLSMASEAHRIMEMNPDMEKILLIASDEQGFGTGSTTSQQNQIYSGRSTNKDVNMSHLVHPNVDM